MFANDAKYSKGLHKLFKLLFLSIISIAIATLNMSCIQTIAIRIFKIRITKFQAPHPFESETAREKNESKTQL